MTDVLIVGAGPVGLSLGIDLARRGISCRIIERSSQFAVGTRARGISPRTQEVFESLGMLGDLRLFAEPNLPARFYDRSNRLVRETPASEPTVPTPEIPYPNALMVSQQNTDAVLRQRLAHFGNAVETDCALVGLTQDDHKVTASVLRRGANETISARYLIGCDGGSSSVRGCVELPFTGETWEDAAHYLIGNLSVTGLDREYWHVWTDPDWGYMTLQPIIHGETWLFVATIQREELVNYLEPTAQSMQNLFERRLPTVTVSCRDLTWHSVYRRNLRIVDRYRAGRVFLAGDSAHVGVEHGMNIGIQDACNLSWKLARVLRGAPEQLLDAYEEERQPIAGRILASTLARDRSYSGNAAAVKSLTNSVLNKDPANDPTQLTLAYRDSSLSRDFEPVTGLRAGDRAPDAPGLMAPTGRPRRLFEVLDSTKFTLLQFTDDLAIQSPGGPALTVYKIVRSNALTGDVQTLLDAHGHAHSAYGINTQALVLIRPDGYIGATGTTANLSAMLRHLRITFSLPL